MAAREAEGGAESGAGLRPLAAAPGHGPAVLGREGRSQSGAEPERGGAGRALPPAACCLSAHLPRCLRALPLLFPAWPFLEPPAPRPHWYVKQGRAEQAFGRLRGSRLSLTFRCHRPSAAECSPGVPLNGPGGGGRDSAASGCTPRSAAFQKREASLLLIWSIPQTRGSQAFAALACSGPKMETPLQVKGEVRANASPMLRQIGGQRRRRNV